MLLGLYTPGASAATVRALHSGSSAVENFSANAVFRS
jgi:hypothetical protein